MYKLKLGEVITTIPTIGFNVRFPLLPLLLSALSSASQVETVQYKSLTMVTWDVGGRDKIRPLWRHYYQSGNGTQGPSLVAPHLPHSYNRDAGLIFVVDSNDRERMDEAAQELAKILREDELRDVKLLVLCNKQGAPALRPSSL